MTEYVETRDEFDDEFDLDLRAEAAEVKTMRVRLTDDGFIHLPLPDYWPPNATTALIEGNTLGALRHLGLAGAELELAGKYLTPRVLIKIAERQSQVSGLNPGEESTSASSSRSTGTKSKRTSGSTTAGSTSETTTAPGSAPAA